MFKTGGGGGPGYGRGTHSGVVTHLIYLTLFPPPPVFGALRRVYEQKMPVKL